MHAMVRLADRFVVLDHGAVIAEGTPAAVTSNAAGDRSVSRQEMGAPMLKVDDVCVSPTAASRALRERVARGRRQGEFVAIVGPNGAGKTTLFKAISGVVPLAAGAHRFRRPRPARDVAAAERAHLGIAHVPEGRQVFRSLTVLENLEMGALTGAGRRAMA